MCTPNAHCQVADGKSFSMDQGLELSDPKLAAMAAVIGTNELLENILECLDGDTLIKQQPVIRRWQALIQQMMRSNRAMRKKLFLAAASEDEVLEGSLEGSRQHERYIRTRAKYDPDGLPNKEPTYAMVNPWLRRCFDPGYGPVMPLRTETLIKMPLRSSVVGSMLLTQPPLSSIIWQLRLGESQGACDKPLTPHTTGEDLYIASRGHERSDGSLQGVAGLLKFVEKKVLQHWGCSIVWEESRILLNGTPATRTQCLDERSDMIEMSEKMWSVLETREHHPPSSDDAVSLANRDV